MAFSKADMARHWGGNVKESLGANRQAGTGAGGVMPEAQHDPDEGTTKLRGGRWINLDRIVPDPDQPRKEFTPEKIESMAESLLAHGQISPISVRWDEVIGKYVIIAGERRYRGAVLARLKQIKAEVDDDDDMSPERIKQKQLVENLIRDDLKPMELAREFHRMMIARKWTAAKVAEECKISEATVSRSLALLDLPEPVQALVESNRMSRTVANEVAKAPEDARQAIADRIIAEGATVARAAELVQESRRAAKPKAAGQGGAKAKGRAAKPKPLKEWKAASEDDKRLKIVATHSKGIDLAALADLMERKAAEIRADLAALAEAG